jgi:hypothetical protein
MAVGVPVRSNDGSEVGADSGDSVGLMVGVTVGADTPSILGFAVGTSLG